MKICKKCGVEKSSDEFYKEKRVKDGLQARCIECCKADARTVFQRNPEPYRKRARNRNPESVRRTRLKKEYGITPEYVEELLDKQEGHCALCPATVSGHNMTDNLLIDHCHTTGKVRGLLCADCNLLLGCAKDDISRLIAATFYLKKHAV
jgi:hypothetical protein